MMSKIISNLNSINNFSKKIIVWVSVISLLLCIGGISIIVYNALALETISLHTIGSTMIYHSIVLFAEFVIVGLILDFFNTLITYHDDD